MNSETTLVLAILTGILCVLMLFWVGDSHCKIGNDVNAKLECER